MRYRSSSSACVAQAALLLGLSFALIPATATAAKAPRRLPVKAPVMTVTDPSDGTVLLAWANMNKPYRVKVDQKVVAVTTQRSYAVTLSPGPGSSSVAVVDAKGTMLTQDVTTPGVMAEGANDHGQLNISGWTGITDIAAGFYHTVGLTSVGSVVATGSNSFGQCDTAAWTGITDVEAGWNHTLGLRGDGTVVATGRNDYGQTNVGAWTGIKSLAAGTSFSAGLKTDGTVVATGRNQYGQCNVSTWTDVVAISCGSVHTIGLKSDGTLLYAGPSAVTGGMFNVGQGAFGSWTGVTAIGAGHTHSLAVGGGAGLVCGTNADGALTDIGTWNSLVAVDGGLGNSVGLRADGTAVVAGQWWDDTTSAYVPFSAVPAWTGLDQVSSQGDFIVGLVR